MFYVGIDIAKNNHEASIIDENGNLLSRSISFTNTQKGCEKLVKIIEKFKANNKNTVIGMEATGHYWLSVYTYFFQVGHDIKVINPIQSDAFRKLYIRQTKKDSFIIAQIMRFGQYSNTKLSDEGSLALKQLSRYRFYLVDDCSDLKRKVITLLDQVFPEYQRLFSDSFGASSKEILSMYPTPEDTLKVDISTLTELLNKASRGRFSHAKACQLQQAAKNSFGIKLANDAFAFQIKQMIQQIIFIESQLKELEQKISFLLHETNQVITTIIGIGNTLGASIVSEIGDITRFSSASKLVAFAGLDVSVKQSGEFLGTQNKISKRDSPYLRRAIWAAANNAAFNDPVLSTYYQSLRTRGKHHLTAIGAVSRKMCNIIFAVLRDNVPYTPKH